MIERKNRDVAEARRDLKGESYRTADIKDRNFFTTVGMERVKIALQYVDKFGEEPMSMILSGGTGTGKTYTASCIATALIDKGVYEYGD